MFREIRKKKNIINEEEINNILEKSRRGVLAINGEDGYPYAIPINYYYDKMNNCIYFHSSKAGYKVDLLKKSNKICFTIYGNEMFLKEPWAPYVQSVVIFGKCNKINDEDKYDALKKFALKYYPDEKLAINEINLGIKAVEIFKIEIDHISGKQIQEK